MFGRWLKRRNSVGPEVANSAVRSATELTGSEPALLVKQQVRIGLAHHQAGRSDEAERAYRHALTIEAHNFDALHLLGLLLHQTQRSEQGADLLVQAIATDNTNAVAWNNLAEIYRTQGLVGEARHCSEKALILQPAYTEAHFNLAVLLSQEGELDPAKEHFERVLALNAEFAAAHNGLGVIHKKQGRLDEALACYERAVELDPSCVDAWNNLGLVLSAQGRLDASIDSYRHALILRPALVGVHLNLGNALREQHRLDEAQACYERALELDPTLVDALNNLGGVLFEQGLADAAILRYREALALRPTLVEAHVNMGNVLRAQRRLDDATASYRHAISLAPSNAIAHYCLGRVLAEQDESDQALACFDTALAYDPTLVEARWTRVMAQLRNVYADIEEPARCRTAFALELKRLVGWFDANGDETGHAAVGSQQPFALAYQEQDNRELLAEYGRLCVRLMRPWQERERLNTLQSAPYRSLKVGIVSAHFYEHSVWNALIKGWLSHLDQSRFELQLFYLQSYFDEQTAFARTRATHFESGIRGLRQWANAILGAQPDVLIYPEIGMDPLTAKLASLRLAPVQATAWGHPETSGLATIDYYLSAKQFEPPDSQRNYTENLVALPNLGCAYERLPIAVLEPDLAKLGIAIGCPLLICPGMPFKYVPAHDWVFPEIARRLTHCQFIFFFAASYPEWTRRLQGRLQRAFASANVPFDRHVVFIASLPRSEFHGLMGRAEVYLDTIGFSGFNSAMEAIGCGLPVVTREGRFMRGRLASGILKRIGLVELVADTEASYIDLIVRLVQDAEHRAAVRLSIERSREVLYNDIESIRALEDFLLSTPTMPVHKA